MSIKRNYLDQYFSINPSTRDKKQMQVQFDVHDVIYNFLLDYIRKENPSNKKLHWTMRSLMTQCNELFPPNNPLYGYVSTEGHPFVKIGALIDLQEDLRNFQNRPIVNLTKSYSNSYRYYSIRYDYVDLQQQLIPANEMPTPQIVIPGVGLVNVNTVLNQIHPNPIDRMLSQPSVCFIRIIKNDNLYYIQYRIQIIEKTMQFETISNTIGLWFNNQYPMIALSTGKIFSSPDYIKHNISKVENLLESLYCDKNILKTNTPATESITFNQKELNKQLTLLQARIQDWYKYIAESIVEKYPNHTFVIRDPSNCNSLTITRDKYRYLVNLNINYDIFVNISYLKLKPIHQSIH